MASGEYSVIFTVFAILLFTSLGIWMWLMSRRSASSAADSRLRHKGGKPLRLDLLTSNINVGVWVV